jgi:hypothetical protein
MNATPPSSPHETRARNTFANRLASILPTERAESRAAKLERRSTRFGAFTRVTLADGFSVEFCGRLDKGEAVRNALWQRAERASS